MLIVVLVFLFIIFLVACALKRYSKLEFQFAQLLSPIILILLGLLQIVGDCASLPDLQLLGMAWGASPAPKVFTANEGLELFSSRIFLSWIDWEGNWHRFEVTPTVANRLNGPYNRRNVYGALLSSGPYLSNNLAWQKAYTAAVSYAMSTRGKLLEELGLERILIADKIWIEIVPRIGKDYGHLVLTQEVSIHGVSLNE